MSGHKKDSKTPQQKKPLPHGWIVVPSKTYPDRVYFYNTVTRCSTWNNPCEADIEEAESSGSVASSSEKVKTSKITCKSLVTSLEKNRKKDNLGLNFSDKNSNIKVDNDIEDYDEQHDQYFNNVPINEFSLSHSNFISPSNSSDSVSSLKTDVSTIRNSKSNELLEHNEKQLLVHILSNPGKNGVKKLVALSDLNEPSTSVKNSRMDAVEGNKKAMQLLQSLSKGKDLKCSKISQPIKHDIQLKRKRSKKKENKDTDSEVQKKSIEEEIKSVSVKKRDKTPAQTRLLKLRKQNNEKLKELAIKHPHIFIPKTSECDKTKKSNIFGVKRPSESDSFKNPNFRRIDICNSLTQEAGNHSKDEFSEEMDWEPSSEESDVRNINVFRQQLDKTNDSSSDIFFGLESDHSLQLPYKTYSWFIVLDTNIFVSCLGFVKELRDTIVPDLGYPVIYVPWRVLQELDHLKDTKIGAVDRHLHSNVRKAIAYLNENFKSRHPRVFGQSFEDFAKMVDVETSAPDDEILQTCIKFQRQHPNKNLMLLTNDKNLESKAIVSGIEVYSKERFQKKYLNFGIVSPTVDTDLNNATSSNGTFSNATTFNGALYISLKEMNDCISEIKFILKDVVLLIVETEMKIAFEGDWVKLAFKKPPWSLQDALECLLKHWRSVFFLVFSKETQSEAQRLFERLYKKETGTAEDVMDIIKTVQRLLISIKRSQKKDRPYLDLVEVTLTKIAGLSNSLSPNHSSEVDSGVSPLLSSVSAHGTPLQNQQVTSIEKPIGDVNKVKNLFRDIWDSLRSFCCYIGGVVHSSSANENMDIQEIRLKVSQIINEVSEMVVIVEKILEISSMDIKENHPLINHFSNFLMRVYPAMEPDLQRELPKCLAAFFTDFEGRSLLSSAVKDFKEFSQELINATEYFNTHLPC